MEMRVNCRMKKKLLYIGHVYHYKTKSTSFLSELLSEYYDVDFATYDPESKTFHSDEIAISSHYDILVLFQMPAPVSQIKEHYKFQQGIYFPMFDGTGLAPDAFWLDYKDFTIINFSRTLNQRLEALGFASHYIQYFPKPMEISDWGDCKSAFLWQRTESLTADTILPLLIQYNIKKLHIHNAPDPNHNVPEPSAEVKNICQIIYSQWLETKEDMAKMIEASSIYFAPRAYEGIGMSFLEAMAMGRCVVAVDHPTMNEYIEHGLTGCLYDIACPSSETVNVPIIQRRTYAAIQEGHAKWEAEKLNIISWMEMKPNVNRKLLRKTERNALYLKQYSIGNYFLVGKNPNGRFYLFGKIPIHAWLLKIIKRIYHALLFLIKSEKHN